MLWPSTSSHVHGSCPSHSVPIPDPTADPGLDLCLGLICIHLATAVLASIWLEHRPNTQVLSVLCHSQPEGNGYTETVLREV